MVFFASRLNERSVEGAKRFPTIRNAFMTGMSLVFIVLCTLLSPLTCSAADESTQVIPTFDISSYKVEGNSILGQTEIAAILAPYTGKKQDFGTIQQAVDALEHAYQHRGFNTVKVTVPEQELANGIVVLKIFEARIGSVTIEGNKYFDAANIRNSLPALQEGTLPNISDISASLRVANENPAKKISLQMEGSEKENEINALLKVADEKPWKVGLSIDDTGNDQSGNHRLGVLLQHANLFNLDHLLTFQYTTSTEKPKRVNIYGLGYRIPWYWAGDSIDLFAGYSDVDFGTVSSGVLDLAVSGKGYFTGIRYNQNLRRLDNYEHRLIYGFDYRSYKNDVTLANIPLGTEVRVHPLSIGYTGSLNFEKGNAGLYLNLVQNFPGGSKAEDSDFKLVRFDAPASYTIFRFGGELAYAFPLDWQGRIAFNGQYTDDPLVPGEQFGLGGATSVRGFDEREVANDIGYAGTAEIYTPDICQNILSKRTHCRALAFYDAGYLTRVKPQPGEEEELTIAGTGVGLRFVLDKYFALNSDYAFVVDPGGKRQRGDRRWHFKATFTF